mgnify:CR=1 FL=1
MLCSFNTEEDLKKVQNYHNANASYNPSSLNKNKQKPTKQESLHRKQLSTRTTWLAVLHFKCYSCITYIIELQENISESVYCTSKISLGWVKEALQIWSSPTETRAQTGVMCCSVLQSPSKACWFLFMCLHENYWMHWCLPIHLMQTLEMLFDKRWAITKP